MHVYNIDIDIKYNYIKDDINENIGNIRHTWIDN